MQKCDDHIRLEREIEGNKQAVMQLRDTDMMTAKAVDRMDARLRSLELKAAKYAGVIAAIASLPSVAKAAEWLIPMARAAITMSLVLCVACSGWSLQGARATLGVAQVAVDQAVDLIPSDAEQLVEAESMAQSALELGNSAISLWEASRSDEPPAVWRRAVMAMIQAVSFILEILNSLDVPIPPSVMEIMTSLKWLSLMEVR